MLRSRVSSATLPHLNLRYRCQDDPDATVAALEAVNSWRS